LIEVRRGIVGTVGVRRALIGTGYNMEIFKII